MKNIEAKNPIFFNNLKETVENRNNPAINILPA